MLGSFDGSHTYADNGVSPVTVTINDSSGGSDTQTFTMTVNNVAPTLAISGAADVNEGSSYTLNLSSSDPGADTITSWTINWGDDASRSCPAIRRASTHTYADGDANYTISATATDEDGTFAAGNTVAVTVNNVAPTLAISGAANVNEGSSYTLNLSSSDPGADTITSWTINWGDGIEIVSGNPASVTHTYADGDRQLHDQRHSHRRGRHVRGRQHGRRDRRQRRPDRQRRRAVLHVRRHADHAQRQRLRPGRRGRPAHVRVGPRRQRHVRNGWRRTPCSIPQALGYTGTQTRTVKLRVSDGDGGHDDCHDDRASSSA